MKGEETKEEIKKRRKRERMKALKYSFEDAEDLLDADKKKLRHEVRKINRNLNKNFNKITKKFLDLLIIESNAPKSPHLK